MKRTIWRHLETWVVVLGAIFLVAWATQVWCAASRTAEESAQRALLAEAAQLLDAYHGRHGQYPPSLDEISFSFRDGGNAATLSTLRYNTDGNHYVILVRGAYSGDEFKECR